MCVGPISYDSLSTSDLRTKKIRLLAELLCINAEINTASRPNKHYLRTQITRVLVTSQIW